MKQSSLLLAVIAAILSTASSGKLQYKRSSKNEYKMCVPEDLLNYCNEMSAQETKSASKIVCIPARDRIDCLTKIKNLQADFEVVDPEDMYVASNIPYQDFAVFEEIRTLEEPDAEYRYEAVAVIHKDLKLDSIADIKGLNSCHTGVGRNVGYKIPLTKLRKMGIIGPLNEPDLSPRENELKAFSTLFGKACIVGNWSPDPTIDGKLKDKYSNLCQLCEYPNKCNYPDKFSGYDGALRCLAHNGGQIAWTKVIFVRKFFGLPVGTTPAQSSPEDPSLFAYLCPDGSRVPVTDTPCRWAARPWQGFMGNADVVKSPDELRRKIENLASAGAKINAPWRERVLELGEKTVPKENKVITPRDYLDKANYTDVVERDYGPPVKTVRFCVVGGDEKEKCRALSATAFSRNVRPRFECIEEKSVPDCLTSIRDNGADIITVDSLLADSSRRDYNLRPIVSETYPSSGASLYTVAVVHKSSSYQSLEDLRGGKSCHPGFATNAGYSAPLYNLMRKGLITKSNCPAGTAFANFFSGGSCMPGVKGKVDENVEEKLCKLCTGDAERRNPVTKCEPDASEAYAGPAGAFRCLVEGGGDVAFLPHTAILANTDGKSSEQWAKDLKSSDFELLCSQGGRAALNEYQTCNMLQTPGSVVITSNAKGDSEVDEITNALLSASDLYSKRPDWFKMFGKFNGKRDLLFQDSAIDLERYNEQQEYLDVLETIKFCN